jgi:MFS family permease
MIAAGILSDRAGQRTAFVTAGIGLIAAGYAILLLASRWEAVAAASVMIGAAFSIFYSLGVAMISQMLPSASNRGKDLGVMNIASTLPQIFMPAAGAALLNTLGANNPAGYTILFAIGGAATLLALLLMRFIRRT